MDFNTFTHKLLLRLMLLIAAPFVCWGAAHADSSNQDLKSTKINFKVNQGKIIDIMDKISKHTDYVFIYEDALKSDLEKKVKINQGETLLDVLSEISKQSNLQFRAVNQNIIIRRKVGSTESSNAIFQGIKVTGRVTSASDGSGIPGANVVVKDTQNGTITDIDGNYSLDVPNADATLVFSYVGYNSEEVAINGRSVIDMTLTESVESLKEIVVTALGIKREEKSLGYSVGQVDGKDLTKVNQENVLNSLAGKIPGVSISSTSARAGASVSMIIRGATSLNGDNQPLFVIDGVPVNNTLNNSSQIGNQNVVDYGNAISDLNPDDIASISVLKGPSAAALYGSRAGNGVVLITTKTGKKSNGLGVSVNSSTVFDTPYKFLEMHHLFASGERPYTPNNNPYPGGVLDINEGSSGWVGPELDKGYSAIQWNSPLDENGNPIATPLVSYPNNPQNFLQTGITSTNNVAIANVKDDLTYRISYTNMSNKGIIPNSDLFRNTLNLSSSYNLTKDFTIEANVNVGRSNSNNVPAGNRGTNPLQALYDTNPHINVLDLKNYWVPGQEGVQQLSVAPGDFNNPYFLAYQAINSFVRNRVFGNLKAEWKITPELTLMGRFAEDQFTEQRETKVSKSYTEDANGIYGLEKLYRTERNTDFLLSYKKKAGMLDFNASVGGNAMYQYGTTLTTSTKSRSGGLIIPELFTLSNISPTSLQYGSSWYEKSIYSAYGLASIGLNQMVYLDLTARNDWSSTLPAENRSYFYPSASLSVLLENMLKMPSEVNMLKLRAGWAQVGKDTDPYSLTPSLSPQSPWGDVTRVGTPSTLLNSELKPEIATSFEVGTDMAFFENRVRFQATYYKSDNKNQILGINLPPSSGYSSKLINAGLVSSKGWEVMLGLTPVSNHDWNWDVNFNFSRNRTVIKELTEGLDFYTFWTDAKGGAWTYVGQTIGDIYDRQLVTVDDPSSPYYGYPILDEDGSWQDYGGGQDKAVKIGNFNPDFTLGMQTTLTYKGFSLSASFDWRQGGQFVSQTYRYGESDLHSQRFLDNTIKFNGPQEDLPQYLKDHADEMIKNGIHIVGGPTAEYGGFEHTEGGITLQDGVFNPGVYAEYDDSGNFVKYVENLGGPDTKYIRYQDNYPWSFTKAATFDASFIKLREISLGYSIPATLTRSLGLQNASVSVFSRNIILWTKAKINIDPENAFQPEGNAQRNGVTFKQGIERYNVMPWVLPVGVKLAVSF